jgi:D-beta-D-heptose 7-phosphate kinase/D-beta-D-heptose 1-phosphate adenosyltransferase
MKLKKINELKEIINELKTTGKKIVFTNGCFDIIHAGHVHYLTQAKALGDVLIIGLNSDESVQRLKGNKRPINDQQARATVLSAFACIDYIVIFEEDTPYNLINHIKPDVLVKGGDWQPDEIVGADIVRSYGGEIKSLDFIPARSTSDIINKIKELG